MKSNVGKMLCLDLVAWATISGANGENSRQDCLDPYMFQEIVAGIPG